MSLLQQAETDGNSMNRSLNEACVMNKLPERFKNKIRSDVEFLLKSNIPNLKGIYLFGSCARGAVKIGSDVDLLVVTEELMKDREQKGRIRCELYEVMRGVATDLVFYTWNSLHSKEDLFTKQLRREGIILWKEGEFSENWKQLL